MAVEDKVLWSDELCIAPFTDGVVATSVEIPNAPDFNALKVVIRYKEPVPDGAVVQVGYQLQAIVEEEITPGVWVPTAVQDSIWDNPNDAEHQIIELSAFVNFNPGTPTVVVAGNKQIAAISRTQGVLGDKFRVRVFDHHTNAALPDLTSIKLSGDVRLYNR